MHNRTERRETTAPAESPAGNPWPIRIFLVSLVIPWVVNLGPATLSMHRIVLLATVLPCLFAFLSGRCGRIRATDVAVLAFCCWATASMIVLTGIGAAAEPSAILFVETAGAYLLARCCIRTAAEFRAMAVLFVAVTLSILPLAVLEATSGRNLALDAYRLVLPTVPDGFEGFRMGLRRAQGVYEHPILFGVNAGCAFALAYLVAGDRHNPWYGAGLAALVAATAALSLSSAPLGALGLQLGLIAWNGAMRAFPQRWLVLWSTLVVGMLVVEALSDRSLIEIYISYFSFNPYNGWYRISIWQYGSAAVMQAPWFGIGYGEWARPGWMTSSVDNFWLAMAMRHGLPAALFLIAALVSACLAVSRRKVDAVTYRYRLAYLAVVAGFFMVGCTVHFWASAHVLFMFMLGSGMWIADAAATAEPAQPPVARPVRGGVAVAGLRPLST